MKVFKQYLPYLFALLLFFAGRFTTPSPDKELIRKFESERSAMEDSILTKTVKIEQLIKRTNDIRKKMVEDSIENARHLKANESAYINLKKQYEKINLRSASTADLDSLRASLYPR
jgi:hypothetical protein